MRAVSCLSSRDLLDAIEVEKMFVVSGVVIRFDLVRNGTDRPMKCRLGGGVIKGG